MKVLREITTAVAAILLCIQMTEAACNINDNPFTPASNDSDNPGGSYNDKDLDNKVSGVLHTKVRDVERFNDSSKRECYVIHTVQNFDSLYFKDSFANSKIGAGKKVVHAILYNDADFTMSRVGGWVETGGGRTVQIFNSGGSSAHVIKSQLRDMLLVLPKGITKIRIGYQALGESPEFGGGAGKKVTGKT